MRNYLVVGCGLYGSVFARHLAEAGHKVFIIDKRNHIAGNCYTEKIHNINVHKYGPHCFHTNSLDVWNYVNRFAEFNDYKLKVKVNYKDTFYSFPINLFTFNQLYGCVTEKEAKAILNKVKIRTKNKNFKSFVLSQLGHEIYNIFYEGYTLKQWNIPAEDLDVSVAKRIPVRFDFNDDYFTDLYQGIPIKGYTNLFENMLDHKNISISLNTDFYDNKEEFEKYYDRIVYTGKLDELFEYKHGILGYRSLRFEEKTFNKTHLGNGIINYTEIGVPYTRIVEHKYFDKLNQSKTVVTYEYPEDYDVQKIPFYPLPCNENKKIYEKYKYESSMLKKYIIGGRLGRYTYLNMDQVIAMSIKDVKEELCKSQITTK